MHVDPDGLRELTRDECRSYLAACIPKVGRVAFLDDGYPVVVPVNYRLLDGQVVFRTGLGSKLEAVLRGMLISFEVDGFDGAWQEGWSVLIKGKAEELIGEERRRAERLGLAPWAPGRKPRYVLIHTEHITGRQIL